MTSRLVQSTQPAPAEGTLSHWVSRHPFTTYVALAYGISWTLWVIALIGGGTLLFLLGALGPMAAAAVVTRYTGGSLRTWISPLGRWRVPAKWWVYALGLPTLLYAVVSLTLQFLGQPVNWSLAADRLPSYAATFLFVLVLGGAMEEPGWRGLGLPILQLSHSPLVATLILGLAWGFWHVPVYGPAGFVVPTAPPGRSARDALGRASPSRWAESAPRQRGHRFVARHLGVRAPGRADLRHPG